MEVSLDTYKAEYGNAENIQQSSCKSCYEFGVTLDYTRRGLIERVRHCQSVDENWKNSCQNCGQLELNSFA